MEETEKEGLERRLQEINKELGILEPKALIGQPPETKESKRLAKLYQEKEQIQKNLGLSVPSDPFSAKPGA